MMLELRKPERTLLPAYVVALKRGGYYGIGDVNEKLEKIALDSEAYLQSLDDAEAKGPPFILPDGSSVPRIPMMVRWMWDGDYCGSVNFRWQKGTEELPPNFLGHIGFEVVEWKRRRGYAKRALKLVLPKAKRKGLRYVDVATDLDNVASQKVVLSNGGELIRRFQKPSAHGDAEALLYRIIL